MKRGAGYAGSMILLTALALAGPTLTSTAFDHEGSIPAAYTCEGSDAVPALAWGELPEGTQALTLIVDDPDAPDPAAPQMTWVHWVLYDLPATAPGIPEGGALPEGTREGLNDWKRTGWGGPCPPIGRHRYLFKLYALSAPLGDLGQPDKAAVEAAMAGKVLGEVALIGTYEKAG